MSYQPIENYGIIGKMRTAAWQIRDSRVIEKSFGHSLSSAQRLNAALGAVLPKLKIFRIDHYLGKRGSPQFAVLSLRQ